MDRIILETLLEVKWMVMENTIGELQVTGSLVNTNPISEKEREHITTAKGNMKVEIGKEEFFQKVSLKSINRNHQLYIKVSLNND